MNATLQAMRAIPELHTALGVEKYDLFLLYDSVTDVAS
jgi:hypothetical protein